MWPNRARAALTQKLPPPRNSHENVFVPLAIIRAQSPKQIEIARSLFAAYAAGLSVNLAFQNFDAELRELPGRYAPPDGSLLLAFYENEPAGCGALRNWQGRICEMKRLYVLPKFRGLGIGLTLARELIAVAKQLRYQAMRLDTLPEMRSAHQLYQSFGFREIEPYCTNPVEGTRFLELKLAELESAHTKRAARRDR